MAALSLFILTWNLANIGPQSSLNLKGLLSLHSDLQPDLYVIGLQESGVFTVGKNWDTLFQNTLYPYGYVQVKSERLMQMVVQVYAKIKHLNGIKNVETVTTGTGVMGFMGNKGGVVVRLDLYGASVCLINSHLAAHVEHLDKRIKDYNAIKTSTIFKFQPNKIMFHDYVFWFGDLNMRLDGSASAADVASAISRNQLDSLFKLDQLTKVRSANQAFSELRENQPKFPPTFKFKIGDEFKFQSQQYNLKRKPAWTDRVLFKDNSKNGLVATQTAYNSDMSYTNSDHRPVIAQFTVNVRSLVPFPKLTFPPVGTWFAGEYNKAKVQLPSGYSTASSDWIGVFPANPISLKSIVSSIRVPGAKGGTTLSLSFPSSVDHAGYYRLIYFKDNDVLGISEQFCVIDRRYPQDGPCRPKGN